MEDITKNLDVNNIAETINPESWMPLVQEYGVTYGGKILGALAIFIIGKWIARRLVNVAGKVMGKANVDQTLIIFAKNIMYAVVMAFIFIAALGQIGVQTASLAAVLAAAGLAVGLALQGSLANFASGVMIILFRPFKVGDVIEAAGVTGSVKDVSIFTTTLNTPDNKVIIVPNGNITSGVITNFSREAKRRVDFTFGIGYDDDIRKAKDVLRSVLEADSRVHRDPDIFIGLTELGDNSVNFAVRVWTNSADYWGVYFDTMEKVKLAFDENGISFPFPQRDVHIHNATAANDQIAA